ncbi:MAG: ABC transporter ATP-binding protein/permease [Lachnospiraceae bacterium]|nr:ABC transporter ATP-binding protein/permease [Lachnospiraceae bacterium]
MLKFIKYKLYVLDKIMPLTKGVRRLFIINLFLSIAAIIAGFIVPLFYKRFIEETIILGKLKTFMPILSGYALIHFGVIGIQYIKNYFNNKIRNCVTFRAKLKMWQDLFKWSFPEYERANIGDTKMYIEDDVQVLLNFSSYYTIDYLIQFATMLVCIVILFVMEWRLALFAIICIPLTSGVDSVLSKCEKALNNEQRENDMEMNAWLYSSLQSWKEVKALNLQNRQKVVFVSHIKKYALYYAKWINYWTLRALIIPKIRNEFLMKFGLYFLGGLLVMNGQMTIGSLLVFVTYFDMLTKAILEVSSTDADLQGKKPYLDRLLQKLDEKYPAEQGEEIETIDSIEIENLSYHYPEQEALLKNVSLTARQGERIAIVGKSGCGKTTLLKLLVGLLNMDEGRILYSGIEINHIKISGLHKRIGFILQNSRLYNMSIKENLLLANPEATKQDIEEACRKACILDFIQKLSDGFDTVIGENGSKLSGGQRQRIVLARAFLMDVDVYIFDEATSAIDQYSEKLINDAIANMNKDKIIIIVAHRESSIQLCNRVIRLGE